MPMILANELDCLNRLLLAICITHPTQFTSIANAFSKRQTKRIPIIETQKEISQNRLITSAIDSTQHSVSEDCAANECKSIGVQQAFDCDAMM